MAAGATWLCDGVPFFGFTFPKQPQVITELQQQRRSFRSSPVQQKNFNGAAAVTQSDEYRDHGVYKTRHCLTKDVSQIHNKDRC
jgi:hypothetical protein